MTTFPIVVYANSCPLADGINVETKNHLLFICERGQVVKQFQVALGVKGTGKRREGDKKTPLGKYELAIPRKSTRYGIFIPIKYPTWWQAFLGYSGKDVGIHGPVKQYRWLGPLNTMFDWTHGCIAVGRNDQIEYIAKWVKSHPNIKVLIN